MSEHIAPLESPQRSSHGNVVAVLLLLVQLVAVAVCGFLGIMLVFVSDSCNSTNCNTGLIVTGMAITALTPAALWVVSLIHVIARGRKDESNWWVPLLWILVSGVAAVVGILVAFQGGPNTFS